MRRVFIASGVIAGLLLSSPVFAQAKAKAQNVPEIAYDSVPNFLKFPPNIYLGEGIGVATNSKGHVFVYTRSGDTRLFEFDQNGTYVREIGAGLYGFTFAHAVRVDKDDNIWTVDEGLEHGHQVQPGGPGGDGHRPAARSGRRARGDDRPGQPAAVEQTVFVQPADRRRLGRAGQHLRHRRLRRQPRGEVRQERPLPQVGRRARQRAGAVEPAAHDGDGRAATSTSATAATRACRSGTTT
jgi:hypothetical protein